MNIPAIRANVGIWAYYVSTLTYEQVSKYIKKVDDELHKSEVLREMLQRSITDNYKQIAEYIVQQEERFFNSLVLAVYDGDPQWHEVRLDYGEGEEYYDIGLLELSGAEKIFPVDGQHRVEGIKKAIEEKPQLKDERIPVIFIGHRNDDDGMRRARRLFSTLNRYAKPVSKRDIIALDEDDSVAIASRELIENHPLFENERVLDSKGKAIPKSNCTAFTTIITFYECNLELLNYYLESKEVRNADGVKLRGSAKTKEYIRFRPDVKELDEYTKLCQDFWTTIAKNISSVQKYLSTVPSTAPFRNSDGGDLMFRPAGLKPFVKAAIHIQRKTNKDFAQIIAAMNKLPLCVSDLNWNGVLWDNNNKKMLMNHQLAVELRLVHLFDFKLLTDKELTQMVEGYASATLTSKDEAAKQLGVDLSGGLK